MTDLVSDPDNPRSNRHRELEKAEIAKSERAVMCVIDAIKSFTNPFNIANKDKLYCLASGAPVSADIETDVLQAEAVGDAAKMEFNQSLQNGDADCLISSTQYQNNGNLQ